MLSRVKQWLVEHAGLDPELLQRDWLDRAIEQRLRQLGVPSEERYCVLLEQDPAERDRIIREVSVGETSFFRYPASYELLVQHLRQRREPSGRRAELRMLSMACATGEEPYSMAIAALYAGWPVEAVSIDAVDRNHDALAVARVGRYPSQRSRQPLPPWASPWLSVEGNEFCVAPAIKPAVKFVQADAVATPDSLLHERYAVVFCRNLLIYLHDEARVRLVDKLAGWLETGGLLFVGHAEQLQSLRSTFQMVSYPGAFALRRVESTGAELPAPPMAENSVPRSRVEIGSVAAHDNRPVEASLRADRADQAVDTRQARHGAGRDTGTHETAANLPLIERARAAADQGRLDAALADIQTALQASAPSAELYQLLGSVQLSLGRLPEARDALRRAVYLEPDQEESLLQLAIVYQRLGDDSHAARYRKRAARAYQNKAEGRRDE